jgi:metal-sulfur cluster biosynthetic enzyme
VSPVSEDVRRMASVALDDGEDLPEADTPSGAPPASSMFLDVPLDEDGMPGVDLLRGALRAVVDPEIGYNIVDLGLVYAVSKPQRGQVRVEMTLTSIGCPLADVIDAQVRMVLLALPGVGVVDLRFTFSPPWNTAMIAGWVREELEARGVRL